MSKTINHCATCKIHACNNANQSTNCPSPGTETEKTNEVYKQEENYKIAQQSAICTINGYGTKTRLDEIIEFSKNCGYKKIGIAFCIGLAEETNKLNKTQSIKGFEPRKKGIICYSSCITDYAFKIT